MNFHNKIVCFQHPSLVYCLWARPGAYPRVEHLKGVSLSWKGLQTANTLAYYESLLLTAVKSFKTLALGTNVIKHFGLNSHIFLSYTLFEVAHIFILLRNGAAYKM
jgi:hypothetical protein